MNSLLFLLLTLLNNNIEALQPQPPATLLSSLGSSFLLKSQGQEDASVLASILKDKDNNKAPEELARVSDLDLQPRQGDVEIESSTPSSSGIYIIIILGPDLLLYFANNNKIRVF